MREAGGPGRGGSSTLPQKRNPVGATGALACAKRAPGLVAALLAALPQEHERGLRRLADRMGDPARAVPAHGRRGCAHGRRAARLEVDPARMRANLEASGGGLVAERIALALAPALGRAAAQERVEAACRRALERGTPLRDVLAADAEIAARARPAELKALLDPTRLLGASAELVERALARHRARQ